MDRRGYLSKRVRPVEGGRHLAGFDEGGQRRSSEDASSTSADTTIRTLSRSGILGSLHVTGPHPRKWDSPADVRRRPQKKQRQASQTLVHKPVPKPAYRWDFCDAGLSRAPNSMPAAGSPGATAARSASERRPPPAPPSRTNTRTSRCMVRSPSSGCLWDAPALETGTRHVMARVTRSADAARDRRLLLPARLPHAAARRASETQEGRTGVGTRRCT